MRITALKIQTSDIHAQQDFYGNTLGLPSQIIGNELRIQIGTDQTHSGELIFVQSANFTGRYHFAFTIPKNQFEAGVHWLEQRTTIASDANGKTRFETGEWNADNVYFFDPQGNILELIVHHDLDESSLDESSLESISQETFGPHSFLHISEIGLASKNVLEMIAWFAKTLEVGTYKSFDETFAPIGDVHGLVIAVPEDRIWFPDTGIPAQILPVELTIRGQQVFTHEIPNTPYLVHVKPNIQEPT
jgi:catechol-2,3-dioxygenase